MSSITASLAGELRLAAATTLLIAAWAFPTHAQPYGGHGVHELIPYQPDDITLPSESAAAPIYLDAMPEFQPAVDVETGEPLLIPLEEPSPVQLPPGVRNGVFQQVFFTGSYLPRLENDSLGFSEMETGVVFGVPFFRVTAPLIITPRYAVHSLDGPNSPDLPARLHDADITFRHLRQFGNGPWAMNAAVTLGHYSDYQKSDDEAFRVTGQAFAVYETSPATQWVFGVVYLNRPDLSVIPAVGVIHQPNPDVRYEAILPRPRISWRVPSDILGSGGDRWAYLAGEFGSGTWSIRRTPTMATPAGTQDLLSYRDFRILVGLERKNYGGLSHRLEAGYVFARELQFTSASPDVQLDDSLFVRLGLTY